MTKGQPVAPEHAQFFSDIAAVLDKHKEVSGNFMLAHVADRSVLADPADAQGECLVWAVDPRTNQRYCVQYR